MARPQWVVQPILDAHWSLNPVILGQMPLEFYSQDPVCASAMEVEWKTGFRFCGTTIPIIQIITLDSLQLRKFSTFCPISSPYTNAPNMCSLSLQKYCVLCKNIVSFPSHVPGNVLHTHPQSNLVSFVRRENQLVSGYLKQLRNLVVLGKKGTTCLSESHVLR